MPTGKIVSAEAQGLYKIFNPGQPTRAEYDGKELRVTGGNVRSIQNDDIRNVKLDLRWLHHALIVSRKKGDDVELSGFKEQSVRDLYAAVSDGVRRHQETIAKQRDAVLHKQARGLEANITELHFELPKLMPKDRYVRKSQAIGAASRIQTVTSRCTPEVVGKLSPKVSKMLSDIRHVESAVTDETRRSDANREFIKVQAALASKTAVKFGYPELTGEQAEAIATDEDVTLIAAGAGTGKTTVIVGKIAHLVSDRKVNPGQILVLAYNNKAAQEIRDRLPDELKDVEVATFHSFGLRVIGEANGRKPSVSKMAGDGPLIKQAMEGFIQGMKQDDELARAILNVAVNMPAQYKSPFDVETEADYQQYVANSELRTLNGELVKSFEELTIANWLAANGIKYQYERDYDYKTSTSRHRQYQPDFYLTDYGIYIEHFALNRDGKAPTGWTGYEEGVAWKREQHRRNQTTLFETYSWQRQDGTLLSGLEARLDQLGVARTKIPVQVLVQNLKEFQISRLSNLIVQFLNHAKSADISQAQIDARVEATSDPRRAREFLKIWREARRQYDARLRQENRIDFHDMINLTTRIISCGDWTHHYTHILIDEFQDISAGRMALAKAMQQNGVAYFLVGDDWQSIYRFTGSQVRLFNEVHEYLGFTQWVALTRTFRFGDDIARPAARFVQQNPHQTQRKIVGAGGPASGGLTVIFDANQQRGVSTALNEIRARQERGDTILLLGRFQKSRGTLPGWAQKDFSTVHSAKGREADYVIVLDLIDDVQGFPSIRTDDSLLNLVAPPIDDIPYPNAEERRLFYVSMTRGKKATYLVADSNRPSLFIRELLRIAPEVHEQGYRGYPMYPYYGQPGRQTTTNSNARHREDVKLPYGHSNKSDNLGQAPLSIGEMVHHAVFGCGIVRQVSGTGDTEQAVIDFGPDIGTKRLMVSMAPLDRVR